MHVQITQVVLNLPKNMDVTYTFSICLQRSGNSEPAAIRPYSQILCHLSDIAEAQL